MLRVTYEHICDLCGRDALASEVFELPHQSVGLPLPSTPYGVGEYQVCPACAEGAIKAIVQRGTDLRTRLGDDVIEGCR